MRFRSLRAGIVAGALVLAIQGLAMVPANAAPDPAMAWTQKGLALTAYEGTSTTQSLDLTFTSDVKAPGVKIDGNLRDVASVDMSNPNVTSGARASVPLILNLPAHSSDTYVGNIQLTDQGRPLPHPLHIVVHTAHWDAQTIPTTPSTPAPDRVGTWNGKPAVIDQLLVATADGVADPDSTIRQIAVQYGGQIVGSVPGDNLYELRLPDATISKLGPISTAIAARPDISMATYTVLGSFNSTTNDPMWSPSPGAKYAQNWDLQAINAPRAWEESTGAGVDVGIIDGGFYAQHEDLQANVQSYTVLSSASIPSYKDEQTSHGTHVAGLACAAGNNGVGIAGVAYNCRLHLDGIDETNNSFALDRIDQAIIDIALQKPKVVNLSLGWITDFDCTSPTLTSEQSAEYNLYKTYRARVARLVKHFSSVLWIFAAANNPVPAECSAFGALGSVPGLDNVVTVAATNINSAQASYSAYGQGITVAAPGGETSADRSQVVDGLYSTWKHQCTLGIFFCVNQYEYHSGTSMAAPLVTGTAALAFSAKPALQPADVKKCLVDGATAGGKQVAGQPYYIIDARNTVDCALGKLNQPPGVLTNVQTIIPGGGTTFALKKDGTVWSWGTNYSGELGNGTTDSSSKPTPVVGLTGVSTVVASQGNGYALKKDGTVWAWGFNGRGDLGNGSTTNSSTPVQVPGLPPIVSLASRGGSAYVAGSDGSAWAWGSNFLGVLGNGSMDNALSPVRLAIPDAVTAVYTGGYTGYALTANGTVWSWGDNSEGQLGNGTTVTSLTPVQVSGLSGATRLFTTNGSVVYAQMPDQTLKVWGEGSMGALGNGTYTNSLVPIDVPNVSPVSQMAVAPAYTFARLDTGVVLSWGSGWDGALGNGITTKSAIPTPVTGISSAISIATNGSSSLALQSDGTVAAWGTGIFGGMGNGSMTESNPTPMTVSGLTGVASIAAGNDAMYAVKSDGTVWSWGSNWAGQLGRPTTTYNSATPGYVGG